MVRFVLLEFSFCFQKMLFCHKIPLIEVVLDKPLRLDKIIVDICINGNTVFKYLIVLVEQVAFHIGEEIFMKPADLILDLIALWVWIVY